MPFLGDYACKVCLQRLSKISLQEGRFLLPTSTRHLGIFYYIYIACSVHFHSFTFEEV
jgi:hypothetical protein